MDYKTGDRFIVKAINGGEGYMSVGDVLEIKKPHERLLGYCFKNLDRPKQETFFLYKIRIGITIFPISTKKIKRNV